MKTKKVDLEQPTEIASKLLTPEELHDSVFYFPRMKKNIGVLTSFDKEQNVYLVNESFLVRAVFSKEGNLEKLISCYIVKEEPKFVYADMKELYFIYTEYQTLEHRKSKRRLLKHKREVALASKRLNKKLHKNIYIRAFNKAGNIVVFVKPLEAYFLGSANTFKVDERTFDCRYFFVDRQWLFHRLKVDLKFRKHMFLVQELIDNFVVAPKLNKYACNVLFRTIFSRSGSLYELIKSYKKATEKK